MACAMGCILSPLRGYAVLRHLFEMRGQDARATAGRMPALRCDAVKFTKSLCGIAAHIAVQYDGIGLAQIHDH